MKKLYRFISIIVMLSMLQILSICSFAYSTSEYDFLDYPDEAITEFSPDMLNRVSNSGDYVGNRGYYDESSLYISPYWSLTVNGNYTPVYATAVYDNDIGRGVLQSFQYIFVDTGASLDIELSYSGKLKNVTVLPKSLDCNAKINGNKISTEITEIGTYTFLINNDSREFAVTLFVQQKKNENAEIESYKHTYGENNVTVFEKGVYNLDTLNITTDVVYFKAGSFIFANHINDIRSDDDVRLKLLGSFMGISNKQNLIITGCGTIDFTHLDRKERTLVDMYACNGVTLENLILLNPNSWTITVYGCRNCTVNNITIFGYRMNSDGINICGCNNMKITNSFCRNGDDSFSVKTTDTNFECYDIEFDNCIGWSNKARCFGITGEIENNIYNISFKNCAVIYRNSVWDNDRIASLAIVVENGKGNIDNITFENIEIHHDSGRPILCIVYGDDVSNCKITNVKYKNINYSADEKIKISSQRNIDFLGNFAAKLNLFIEKHNLNKIAIFRNLSNKLNDLYDETNTVEVSFENVKSANKFDINKFSTYGNSYVANC